MANNINFDENTAYLEILRISDNAKQYLEGKRDFESEQNPENKESIDSSYKNKLQSVYRVRNNAFGLLLRNGYKCKAYYGAENKIFVSINAQGTEYEVEAASLKNILFKDFENILNNTLIENSELKTADILSVVPVEKTDKKKNKNKTLPVPDQNILPEQIKIADEQSSDEILDMISDIKIEKHIYEVPEKKDTAAESFVNEFMPIFAGDEVKPAEKEEEIPEEISIPEVTSEDADIISEIFFDIEDNTKEVKNEEIKDNAEIVVENNNEVSSNLEIEDNTSAFEIEDNTSVEDDASVFEVEDNTSALVVENNEPVFEVEDNTSNFEIEDNTNIEVENTNNVEELKDNNLPFEVKDTNNNSEIEIVTENNITDDSIFEVVTESTDSNSNFEVVDTTNEDVQVDNNFEIETNDFVVEDNNELVIEDTTTDESEDFGLEIENNNFAVETTEETSSFEIVDETASDDRIFDDVDDEPSQSDNLLFNIETQDSNDNTETNVNETFVIESDDTFEVTNENVEPDVVVEEPVKTAVEKTKQAENSQKIKAKSETMIMCPYCRSNISDNNSICPICGYDLMGPKDVIEDIKKEESEFDENDIKKILDEIKADYEKAKKEEEAAKKAKEEEKKKSTYIDYNAAPKSYERDTFKDVKMYSPNDSDPIKKKVELICDIYKIKSYDRPIIEENDEENQSGYRMTLEEAQAKEAAKKDKGPLREITVVIFPLTVPENGNARTAECAIYIEEDGARGCFGSLYGKTGTVVCETQYHIYKFQWNWVEGVPSSRFIYDGLEREVMAEVKQIEIRPSDISVVGYGHPYATLVQKYIDGDEKICIHALNIPDVEPNEDGKIPCLFVLEDPNSEDRRVMITNQDSCQCTFGFNNSMYLMYCKEENDEIKLELVEKK